MSRIARFTILAVLISLLSSCSQNEKAAVNDGAVQDTKSLFSNGRKLSVLKSKKLSEVSGLAASLANPGMLWTLNDSNNPAEVFLIDLETNIKQTYKLKGVPNRDWEEISVGPGPEQGTQYVYVGDIGDNMAVHDVKYIYRFKEPVYKSGAEKTSIEVTDFDTITFSLSDERRDTEAFFVEPGTRDIYIISKWKNDVDVYQLKYSETTNQKKRRSACLHTAHLYGGCMQYQQRRHRIVG